MNYRVVLYRDPDGFIPCFNVRRYFDSYGDARQWGGLLLEAHPEARSMRVYMDC